MWWYLESYFVKYLGLDEVIKVPPPMELVSL